MLNFKKTLRRQLKLFFFVTILIIYSNPVFSNADLPPDIKRINDNKKIIIAMFKDDSPPFFMIDNENKFTGIDVEIANDIAKRLGVGIEFNRDAATFEEVVDMVASKKADIAVSMLSFTLQRAKKIRFTDPYFILHQSLLINRLEMAKRKKDSDITNLFNNQKSRIGVLSGTSYVDFLKDDFPLAEHFLYDDFNNMVSDVISGKIFALFYDEVDIQNWQHNNPKAGLYLQPIIMNDKPDPISIGVHWQDTQLHSWLNHYLKIIELEGKLKNLKKYYLEGHEWRKTLKTNQAN